LKQNEILVDEQHILGTGATSTVYCGSVHGMKCAVKVYPAQCEQNFIRELTSLRHASSHRNVVDLVAECRCSDGKLMLAMELVEGGSLFDALYRRSNSLSVVQRLKIARDVAAALCWLHRETVNVGAGQRFAHGDVKSSNVLLDSDFESARLIDFGATPSERSVRWCAPEVLGGAACSQASDVYSFGMLLYEMLGDALPWPKAMADERVVVEVCVRKRRPPIDDAWPRALRDLLAHCWRAEPAERPTFAEVVPRIDAACIDAALHFHEAACRFWQHCFQRRRAVPVAEFVAAFDCHFGAAAFRHADDVATFQHAVERQLRLAAAIVASADSGNGAAAAAAAAHHVDIDFFDDLVHFFGLAPDAANVRVLVGRYVLLCRAPFFCADVSRADAQRMLAATQRAATFLLRYSASGGRHFTLSTTIADASAAGRCDSSGSSDDDESSHDFAMHGDGVDGKFLHFRVGDIDAALERLPNFLRSRAARKFHLLHAFRCDSLLLLSDDHLDQNVSDSSVSSSTAAQQYRPLEL
jgi:tRNA A-37 threonylcarbamoyl transferase component Bud32